MPERRVRISAEAAARSGVKVPSSVDRLITPTQAAAILGVTDAAVKYWIYRRRLPAVKLGNGYWKIKVSDFEKFLEDRLVRRNRHVLFVANADTAKVLEGLPYVSVTATNYVDALLKARDLAPVLAVVDLGLNGLAHWVLIAKLRGKPFKRFPVLLLAENPSETDLAKAVECGACGLLRTRDPGALRSEIEMILC